LPYIYLIANIFIVLHPRHKLSYFKNAGWEDEWVETAEALVRDEYKHSYEDMIVKDCANNTKDNDLGGAYTKGDSSKVCTIFLARSLPVLTQITDRARTSLIIYQHLCHQKQETSTMSWTAISVLTLRMLQMFSHGGMNAVDHSLISLEWRWIT
jgi:hypothetical protein